jgi:2-keto-4-pentenoate hydratase/2-oxohepta-3-ene-1,7-dioic acid hydratase in catechol pathway
LYRPNTRLRKGNPRRIETPDQGIEERECHAGLPIDVRLSPRRLLYPFTSIDPSILATNNHSDLIFSVPKLVSFLSQGTTLPAGTIILTGTPPGVGAAKNPKEFLKGGDEFRVELSPLVGTLINKIENQ